MQDTIFKQFILLYRIEDLYFQAKSVVTIEMCKTAFQFTVIN